MTGDVITQSNPTIVSRPKHSWLVKPIAWKITPAIILISLITLLSLGLHLYKIKTIGNANEYYTAAVKSMLQSWHNFFFVAAEPGGSVTLDKPPLGFWVETAFAAVLGLSGFSVSLPNILAGVVSVPLLYHLVKRTFNAGAGLVAALVLALTPVSIAVDRNNTIDGMLILVLLLAAWGFIRATETSRLKYLLLGAALLGVGFNIKMLEAFLPLPAFYALYLLGAKTGWRKKIGNLLLASILLIVISFAWPLAVDLTPAAERPYVGGTTTNSEFELIFGYNGISRLLGRMRDGAPGSRPGNFPGSPFQGDRTFQDNPAGGGFQPPAFQNNPPAGFRSGPGLFNTGNPGPLRFFQAPLAKEMSWMLPFGLISLLLLLFVGSMSVGGIRNIKLPLESNEHQAFILWGGWLLTCLVFFSIAGFFHNYYLGTVAPALAVVVGIGFYALEKLSHERRSLSVAALLISAGITITFQLYLVKQFGLNGFSPFMAITLTLLAGIVAVFSLVSKSENNTIFRISGAITLIGLLLIPGLWSVKTASAAINTTLPEAYAGDAANNQPGFNGFLNRPADGRLAPTVDSSLLSFLEANTQDRKYLVAVPSAQIGSNLVLQTGRPVLYMGGFSGSDPVVNAASLAELVGSGQLRYILYNSFPGFGGSASTGSDISSWIQANCQVVTQFSQSTNNTLPGFPPGDGFRGESSTLYQCSQNP